MAVITITIEESEEQLLFGIPRYITLSTNVPSTIFYTLDGSDPDTSSPVYVGVITMPRDQNSVTLKAFATDGVDSSAVISETYQPDITGIKLPRDTVSNLNAHDKSVFPYASGSSDPPYIYGDYGPSNSIVDKPGVENIQDGYDAEGNLAFGTDLTLDHYLIRYSETNYIGQRGHGLGTLPTDTELVLSEPPQASANFNDAMFDPRALVIYQDSREEPRDPEVVHLNRARFSLQDSDLERERDGALLQNIGYEKNGATGTFVKAYFNPRENTTTYYYFDSHALRWIISTNPAVSSPSAKALTNIVFASRDQGSRFLYKWYPFKRTKLI